MRRIKPITWIIVLPLLAADLAILFFVSNPQALAASNVSGGYQQNNLVSDIQGNAKVTDAHLHNP